MKIEALEIENFMALNEARLELADKGLILIQGENKDDTSADSNGAGKSTVADALSWGLYGVTARGVSGDNVINDQVGKQCRIKVDVDDDGEKYEIVRHRKYPKKRNVLEVFHNGKDISKSSDKLTQKVIDRIMGCTADVFNAAIYSGQENMPDLPALTDKYLKDIVEEAAGITLLNRAYEVAKVTSHTAKARGERAEAEYKGFTINLETIKTQAKEVLEGSAKWHGEKEARIKKVTKDIEEEGAAWEDKHKAHTKIGHEIGQKRDQIKAMEPDLEKLKSARKKRVEFEQTLQSRQKQFVKLETQLEIHKTAAQTWLDEAKNIDKKIGSPCSECGKVVEADDVTVAQVAAKTQSQHSLKEAKTVKSVLETAKITLSDAQRALEEFDDSIAAAEASKTLCDALTRDIERYESQEKDLEAEKVKIDARWAEIEKIKEEKNPFDAQIESTKERLSETKKKLEEAEKELAEAGAASLLARSALAVFGPSGVRSHILDTVTPFLNEQTSQYLAALSDGEIDATWQTLTYDSKGDLKEKFSIQVEKSTGAKSFAGLSGGEKRKVRLSCSLALQDLVASRSTKAIDLWIGDEIDDALDASGLERLMGILEDKARERGSVLVISHNELNDWIRDTITVTKEHGRSTVR